MVPEIANIVISLFAPVLISFLKDVAWKGWQKRLLALAVSIVIGVLVAVISQETQGEQWAQHLFIAIATAQAAYALVWDKTAVETAMRKSGVGSKK